ncbi:MAG: hypothetical protein ACXIU7_05340 [Roseinatronobacter sp.]
MIIARLQFDARALGLATLDLDIAGNLLASLGLWSHCKYVFEMSVFALEMGPSYFMHSHHTNLDSIPIAADETKLRTLILDALLDKGSLTSEAGAELNWFLQLIYEQIRNLSRFQVADDFRALQAAEQVQLNLSQFAQYETSIQLAKAFLGGAWGNSELDELFKLSADVVNEGPHTLMSQILFVSTLDYISEVEFFPLGLVFLDDLRELPLNFFTQPSIRNFFSKMYSEVDEADFIVLAIAHSQIISDVIPIDLGIIFNDRLESSGFSGLSIDSQTDSSRVRILDDGISESALSFTFVDYVSVAESDFVFLEGISDVADGAATGRERARVVVEERILLSEQLRMNVFDVLSNFDE